MAIFPYLNTMTIVKPVHVVCTAYYLKILEKMLSTFKINYTSLSNLFYFFQVELVLRSILVHLLLEKT